MSLKLNYFICPDCDGFAEKFGHYLACQNEDCRLILFRKPGLYKSERKYDFRSFTCPRLNLSASQKTTQTLESDDEMFVPASPEFTLQKRLCYRCQTWHFIDDGAHSC